MREFREYTIRRGPKRYDITGVIGQKKKRKVFNAAICENLKEVIEWLDLMEGWTDGECKDGAKELEKELEI